MKRSIGFCIVLFFLPLFVYTQSLDEKLKEIDSYAQTVMDTWHGPGMAIALVKDDKMVFEKGYGVKWIDSPATTLPNASPEEAYKSYIMPSKTKT